MTSSVYEECPLKSLDSLRLLKLNLDQNDSPGLSCQMEAFDFGKTPNYTALSYTWDSPYPAKDDEDLGSWTVNNHTLTCNGTEIQIRRNLFLALKSLHALDLDTYLWVDAICIDQNETQELGEQVTRMGMIYSGADEVIAWIGEDSPEAQDFAWIHNTLLPNLQKMFNAVWNYGEPIPHKDYSLSVSQYRELGLDEIKRYGKSYHTILNRRWFHRAWMAQEIGLAKVSRILCGNTFTTWSSTVIFSGFLIAAQTEYEWSQFKRAMVLNDIIIYSDPITRLDGVGSLSRMDRMVRQVVLHGASSMASARSSLLLDLAQMCRALQCKDGRDNLYSMYGLVNSLLTEDPEGYEYKADYNLSVEEVFTSVVTRHLELNSSLFCLTLREDLSIRGLLKLPTWVPDFSAHSSVFASLSLIHYDASKFDPRESAHAVEGGSLIVHGTRVDTIVQSNSMQFPQVDAKIEYSYAYWKNVFDFCSEMEATYSTGEDRVTALWRTLTCNAFDGDLHDLVYPLPDEAIEEFYNCVLHTLADAYSVAILQPTMSSLAATTTQFPTELIACFQSVFPTVLDNIFKMDNDFAKLDYLSETQPGPKKLPTILEIRDHSNSIMIEMAGSVMQDVSFISSPFAYNSERSVMQSAARFARSAHVISGGRCLQRGYKGFIAHGPISSAPGDEIWILKGGKIPFILRPEKESGSYTLVGGAYVHGIMNGEFLSDQNFGGFSNISIV